eukprot:CAMPEP_0174908388 /NCGR_PEP_ID=MMETSP0167-20121228/64637_1 /TAXON_ID=38298 /ORGANISM="Rhodella maculata, Strain CCMP736" /LENGTH=95 /DNA_ID=CAMNT_0016152135 /DNA_START=132 /DNA_END=419 /DNA_ORIENTATION=+
MVTGNARVFALHWHASSSSLLAHAHNIHAVMVGPSGRCYMYGEHVLEYDEDHKFPRDYWPRGALHEPSYFGPDEWHCNNDPHILQYSFDNGQPMI